MISINSKSDHFLLKKLSPTEAINLTLDDYQRLTFYRDCGLEFSELNPEFCQLSYPLDLLDTDQIRSYSSKQTNSLMSSIERHHVIDSTNSALLNFPLERQHGSICIAEYQTAGRGRHGRNWVAPFASGLCLSAGWRFKNKIEKLQLISLLPAVALIRILKKIGLDNVGVKWPNDILCEGDKLAGILIEMPADISDQKTVVIGIGVNVYNRTTLANQIDQPWVSLDQKLETVPSRNELAALLISELFNLLQEVEECGLENIRDEWRKYDLLINMPVTVLVNTLAGEKKENGISRGINDDGSVNVEIYGELKKFVSGEISLRLIK